jgi:hypothetical protein
MTIIKTATTTTVDTQTKIAILSSSLFVTVAAAEAAMTEIG